jgi:hypothetical protein
MGDYKLLQLHCNKSLLNFFVSMKESAEVSVLFSEVDGSVAREKCRVHLVPHFEEFSLGLTVNWEFILWKFNATFPIFNCPWFEEGAEPICLFIYVLPLCLILQSCQTFLLFEAIKVIYTFFCFWVTK